MKLLGSAKSKIKKIKMVKMYLIKKLLKYYQHSLSIVNNSYQQNSRVLYTFIPNKSFDQLLDISPKKIYIF